MSDLIEFFASKMTSVSDPNAKCPKCKTTVYYAEERVAGGNKWHEKCFKCGELTRLQNQVTRLIINIIYLEDCRKVLDSTNCAEYGKDKLYCQNCYSRKFGPKGYGFCQAMENNEK